MNKTSPQNFIILGPPGSGKGTQAKRLAEKLGEIYFGTGDLMRVEAEKGTPLGLEFKKVMASGKLVSDELVEKFVEQKLNEIDTSKGLVFDGYPRTVAQAEYLDEFLKKKGIGNLKVLNLVVKAESITHRMLKRRICQSCGKIYQDAVGEGLTRCDFCQGNLTPRHDDDPEVVGKRIEVYTSQSAPLIEYFKGHGQLIDIDGEPPIEEVWENIEKVTSS